MAFRLTYCPYIVLIIFLLATTNHICNAQEYLFRARIISADSIGTDIRNCHIINKTKNLGTVSDQYGNFRITADINDSILFSAIGYEKLEIALSETIYNNSRIIRLNPVAYELEEVTVKPFQIELPMISKYEIYTPPLPNQGGINIPTGVSPISFFYNRFSKEAKQKKYYKSVTEETADFIIIGEKFNGNIVSRLTGLKDDEMIAFISYCAFTTEFLRYMSPETIKREILRKYRKYTETKEEENLP